MDDDLGIDFDPLAEDISSSDVGDDMLPPIASGAMAADLDADDLGDEGGDGGANGKSSVRDIMTWKDAIGMMIETNMEARSRAPQNSHPHSHSPRGQRGGRGGRGGGRGGRGRGGHR
jgi:hypothetical protein